MMDSIQIEGNKITLPHFIKSIRIEAFTEKSGHGGECYEMPIPHGCLDLTGDDITITREEAPLKFEEMFHRSRSEGGSKGCGSKWTRKGINYYAWAEGIMLRFNNKSDNKPSISQAISIIDLDADWYPYRPEDE